LFLLRPAEIFPAVRSMDIQKKIKYKKMFYL